MKVKSTYVRYERIILGLCGVSFILLGWEGLERGWWSDLLRPLWGEHAESLHIKRIFISSPSLVASAAYQMFFVSGEIWSDLAASGMEFLLGLGTAVLIGVPLGLTVGWYRKLSYCLSPFIAGLNATPQVAFLPLFVIWFGTGLGTKVLIIVLLAVLPIAINAEAAVRTTDSRLVRLARSFSASDAKLFLSVVLPTAIPFVISGLRLAVGRAMIGIVVAEVYGSAGGMGMMMSQSGSRFETDRVFVGVLTIVAVGLLCAELLRLVEQRLEHWRA